AFIVVAAAAVAVVWGIAAQMPALRAALVSGNTLGAAVAVLHSPTSKAVLSPFRLMLAPVFTPSSVAWFSAVWPALLIVAAHVVWVLRTDAAFEEAAAANASRRALALAKRAGRTSMPAAGPAPAPGAQHAGGSHRLEEHRCVRQDARHADRDRDRGHRRADARVPR